MSRPQKKKKKKKKKTLWFSGLWLFTRACAVSYFGYRHAYLPDASSRFPLHVCEQLVAYVKRTLFSCADLSSVWPQHKKKQRNDVASMKSEDTNPPKQSYIFAVCSVDSPLSVCRSFAVHMSSKPDQAHLTLLLGMFAHIDDLPMTRLNYLFI